MFALMKTDKGTDGLFAAYVGDIKTLYTNGQTIKVQGFLQAFSEIIPGTMLLLFFLKDLQGVGGGHGDELLGITPLRYLQVDAHAGDVAQMLGKEIKIGWCKG